MVIEEPATGDHIQLTPSAIPWALMTLRRASRGFPSVNSRLAREELHLMKRLIIYGTTTQAVGHSALGIRSLVILCDLPCCSPVSILASCAALMKSKAANSCNLRL